MYGLKTRFFRHGLRLCLVALLALPLLSVRAAAPPPVQKRALPPKESPFLEKTGKVLYAYEGDSLGDLYGWVGDPLGDQNGDGVSEYLVTAVTADGNHGKIYIYDGRTGDLIITQSPDTVQLFGYSATDAGDVNHDGIPDYIVGGPAGSGRAVVFSGADHQPLQEWTGDLGSFFGASVAGAGDVNADGYADVIVGAPSTPNGLVEVFSGQDGSLLWSREGLTAGADLGVGLDSIGDINMDGVPDVVAAADAGGPAGTGQAYVFSGADGSLLLTMEPNGSPSTYGVFFARGAGDMNLDGTPDIFIGDYNADGGNGRAYVYSGSDGTILLEFLGQPGEGLGPGRAVEDLNGDGYRDLVIAGYTYGSTEEGRIYFFSGKDGSVLRTLTGSIPGDNLGVDALPLGDLNGDGRPEFMLTSVGNDFAGLDVGRMYVVSLAPFKPDKAAP
ncbi:MAG: FG-GAP-like repeat-containing protein [Anaerolineales bacterium]